ncbi:FAD-dependent oxidoreductase [Pacificibacter marinus]|nr:FAD-dependent oxidoreductase [Pacificibacter marinus]
MDAKKLVIIGAGMAPGRLLDHLIAADPQAFDVTLFNAEKRGTYNRLMLSPVLSGEKTYADIVTHDDVWYAKHGVTCRFDERVLSIDPVAKMVVGEKGSVAYDKLVIATGSTPFMIPIPGHDLPGVIAYRDLEDTEVMIALGRKTDARAVVIGGGVLGLEAAAGMAARGVNVTVVHNSGHVMNRQLDAPAGGLLRADLEARGIQVLCNAASKQIVAGADGRVRALQLIDGTEIACDLLVMAVGIRPNVSVAADAGLNVDKGVVVDDHMQTSNPNIFGLGECVEHNGALFGLVAPLYDQAEVLAKTLLGQSAQFVPKELSTKLKVTGCDLFSAGDFEDGDDRESIVFHDKIRRVYKRLVIKQNKLIGAVLYGETADGAWFYQHITAGTNVASLRDQLIFGPAFDADHTQLPQSAITSDIARPASISMIQESLQ